MSQTKSLEEIVKSIVYETIHELNNELQDEYQFKLHDMFVEEKDYEVNIEMKILYSIKLMEISYVVSDHVEQYIIRIEDEEKREVSEEEAEELFNEFYENELRELNNMYMYNVNAEIKYDLSEIYPFYSGELHVVISPLPCDGDYCNVGSDIRIVFNNIRRETIEKASDKFAEFLIDLLRLIHNIITL